MALIVNFTRLNDPLEAYRATITYPKGDLEQNLQQAIRHAFGGGASGKFLTPARDLILIFKTPREAYAVFRAVWNDPTEKKRPDVKPNT